jgi:hypothetical protein
MSLRTFQYSGPPLHSTLVSLLMFKWLALVDDGSVANKRETCTARPTLNLNNLCGSSLWDTLHGSLSKPHHDLDTDICVIPAWRIPLNEALIKFP